MGILSLDRNWYLHEAPLDWDADALQRVLSAKDGWLPCSLPCDVHMPLMDAGIIRDPAAADYSFSSEWIEQRSWWFTTVFSANREMLSADLAELTLESLDAWADVFLNGEHIGHHESAHYPFTKNVYGLLREGENRLTVRMTTGLEYISESHIAEIGYACTHERDNGRPDRGDKRRSALRKPHYCVGWDWAPRCVTCGIVKGAYLRTANKITLRNVHAVTESIAENCARVHITAEVDNLNVFVPKDCDICAEFAIDGNVQHFVLRDVLLTSGRNYIDLECGIKNPQLWWPAGYGKQPLYDLTVTVVCDGATETARQHFGIRIVNLDTSKTEAGSRRFRLVVNETPIFCKGGNWIPADLVYARTSPQRYETLIREAYNADFNMLRIWGGGIYEAEIFYELCDRYGILVWQDLMNACTAMPDHLETFQALLKQELEYQTKRISGHTCIALFCGNNESHAMLSRGVHDDWSVDLHYGRQYGLAFGNIFAKEAIRKNCPEIPFWNSSPYGGGDTDGEAAVSGDVHYWGHCMMNPDMAKRIEPREYDLLKSAFVSEYGYPGPCCMDSIREFFDGQPVDRNSRIWNLHNNAFEKNTVNAGIEKHYLDGAADLSPEDYILYAGLVQSLMLEYSLEAIRFKDHCGGGLFWMYNDAWCEVGWTVIDYYLRRKISYFGVKRAFAPIKLTLREENGIVTLQGCNDTPEDLTITVKLGCMALSGKQDDTVLRTYTIPGRSRIYLETLPLPEYSANTAAFVALPESGICAPAVLYRTEYRNMRYPGAKPKILSCKKTGSGLTVTLTADAFIHGVHLPDVTDISDNYFDLLPGQEKTVVLYHADTCPDWKTVF